MAPIDRRSLLVAIGGLAGVSVGPSKASAQPAKTRLILLGTGGGPRPRTASSASAQAVVVDDQAYVIDCGNGVARQLVSANVPLTALRHLFITHHHSDHNADYGNLMLLAWASGLKTRIDTWGPPPLEKMTRLFFEMSATDIEARIANEGRVPLVPLVHVHELSQNGLVMQDEYVKVTSALVEHPPMVPSFGFRFDTADRSIVISGDTARSDRLVELAKGADVLVHSAVYMPAVDRLIARVPNATLLKQSIIAGQTSVEDAGRVAQAAGVKTLVLSHLIPPDDPSLTEQMWVEAVRPHFHGASSSAGTCRKSSTWPYGFGRHPAKSADSSSIPPCKFRSVVQPRRIVSLRST